MFRRKKKSFNEMIIQKEIDNIMSILEDQQREIDKLSKNVRELQKLCNLQEAGRR